MTATVLDFPSVAQAQLPGLERDTDAVITRLVPASLSRMNRCTRSSASPSSRTAPEVPPAGRSSRHHLAICHAYLDAAAIVAGHPDIAIELAQCLDVGVFDIKKLTRIARNFDGPAPA
jgi:hypothetical protein